MRKLSVILFGAILMLASSVPISIADTRLTVNWSTPIGPVNPEVFGSNIFGMGTEYWGPLHDTQAYKNMMRDINYSSIRIHNGSASDIICHGGTRIDEAFLIEKLDAVLGNLDVMPRSVIFSVPSPPGWMNPGGGMLPADKYQAFANFCADYARIIVGHYGFESVYFEPLNEPEDTYDGHLDQLWRLWVLCAQKIKTVDPEIKLLGPTLSWANTTKITDFIRHVDSVDPSLLDGISWHSYATGNTGTTTPILMESTADYGEEFISLRGIVDSLRPNRDTELIMDEFNISWNWDPPEPRHATHVGAAWFASVVNHLIRSGADKAMTWHIDGASFGMISDDAKRLPSSYLYEFLNNKFMGTACEISGVPQGLEGIAAHSPNVDAVMLINKTAHTVKNLTLNMGQHVGGLFGRIIDSEGVRDVKPTGLTRLTMRPYSILMLWVEKNLPASLWHFDGNVTDAAGAGYGNVWPGYGYFVNKTGTPGDVRVGSHAWAAIHTIDSSGQVRSGQIKLTSPSKQSINGTRTFGLAMWVKPMATDAYGRLWSFGVDRCQLSNYDPLVEGGSARYGLSGTGLAELDQWWDQNIDLREGVWQHFALTADGTTVRVFIDNELRKSWPQTGTLTASNDLYLGVQADNQDHHSGFFDEVVMINKAVGPDWVDYIYHTTVRGINLTPR